MIKISKFLNLLKILSKLKIISKITENWLKFISKLFGIFKDDLFKILLIIIVGFSEWLGSKVTKNY